MDQQDIERIRNPGFPIARRGYEAREVDRFLRELSDWLETRAAEELGSFAVKHKLELAGQTTAQILLTTEQECEQMLSRATAEATDMVEQAKRTAQRTTLEARSEAKQTLEDADAARLEIEAAARETRSAADAYSAETQASADVYSHETRTAADGYAAQTHTQADDYSTETRAAADAYAADTRRSAEEDAEETQRQASAKARRTVKDGEERRNAIETLIADLRDRRDEALAELEALGDELYETAKSRRPPASGDPFAKPGQLDPLERVSAAEAPTPARTGE